MITTERLELSKFQETDLQGYVNLITQSTVTQYLADGAEMTKEEATNRAPQLFNDPWEDGYGVFVVREKTNDEIIGYCGIRVLPDERIELLYAYDPSSWGKGYATEAGAAVLAYGKEHFDLTELIGIAYPENKGSIAVLKKLGFEFVGVEEYFGKALEVFVLKV